MNYEDFTLVELRQLAKEKGLKNVSKVNKADLIAFLNENEKLAKEEPVQEIKEEKDDRMV